VKEKRSRCKYQSFFTAICKHNTSHGKCT
jgi:hypothetical protein